jgi:3-oxoacyl-[acyl-carrier protein] reductase
VLVPGDLEDPAVPAEVVNSAADQLGRLDALVMSHTESVDSAILDTTVESFDRHYAVNIRATWLLMPRSQGTCRRPADRSSR